MTSFRLVATISTDNPAFICPILKAFIEGKGSIEEVGIKDLAYGKKGEFLIQARMEGESSKELNRALFFALRKVEKHTSIRSA